MTMTVLKELWTNLKELVYFCAAIGGVIVAFQGLNTWKKQIRGRAEYEAARKLFKAILQIRDAISYVRNPWIPVTETISAQEYFKKQSPNKEINQNTAVYQLRWNKITQALSALQLELLEAEVFWGDDVQKIQKPIRQCVDKLNSALSQFLNPDLRTSRDYDGIIYEVNVDTEKDDFTKEIEQPVQKVADFLKPKLKI